MRTVVECSVLWRLQPRPALPKEPVRHAVQPGDFDDKASIGLERRTGVRQRPQRVVVVLEEVPHCDEVEAIATDRLVVEQTVMKLDSAELVAMRQIHEVNAAHGGTGPGVDVIEESTGSTADIQYDTR